MNLTKQKSFNEKMGRAKHFPRHQNLSKGGMVDKRKHFDDGGAATTAATPTSTPNVGGNTTQGGLFGALTSQSGYQAQLAPTTQLNYIPTVGAASQNALNPNTVNSAIGSEQNLANEYQGIANGTGPNPALNALNQQTATNVANTAALQAGQRGGSQNAGLLARQIGQQGAATQQAAVGQAATTQANQQLGALGAEGTLQNAIATQGLGEQGVNSNVYATALGGNNAQNNTNVSNYGQAQGLNQSTANANTQATSQTSGGIIGGIGSLLSFEKGGEVEKFDDGGSVLGVAPLPGVPQPQTNTGPSLGVDTSMPNINNSTIATGTLTPQSDQSYVGKFLQNSQSPQPSDPTGWRTLIGGIGGSGAKQEISGGGGSGSGGGGGLLSSVGSLAALLAKGGQVHPGPHKSHVANYLFAEGGMAGEKVPCLVSPKEVILNPEQVKEVVERGADPMKIGEHVPGRDKVHKNSIKNDVVPRDLHDGSVVLPIEITTHKGASEKGRKFVEKEHAKRYMKKPKGI